MFTICVMWMMLLSPFKVQPRTLEEQYKMLVRDRRYLSYTYNSAIGMFLAFAVPVVLDERDIIFSYNFEANYNLPTNISQYDLTPPERGFFNSINRTFIYTFLKKRLHALGDDGRQCLLQTICEASKFPLLHNGLLGDLLHIIFSPSTSEDEEGLEEEREAERRGKSHFDCSALYNCSNLLLDRISEISDDKLC